MLYNVLVDVANPDGMLMTEMTAHAFFVLGAARNVPIVPMAALTPVEGAEPGAYVAEVMTEHGIERREVRIGLSNRTAAEVVSGLEAGDRVVTGVVQAGNERGGGSMSRMRL